MTTTLRALRDLLDGRVVLPDDDAWDRDRRPWFPLVDQRPPAVVHAAGIADVQATVRFAADHGLAVAAQPSGHGATDALDGAILLRTGALDRLVVDAGARTASIGAGVPWGQVLQRLDGTGLVGLAGSHAGVVAVPFTLGGGLSWFSRAHGAAAGSLRAAHVVDAAGEHRLVDAGSDPDLFWALRGGGGDFGVVTQMEVDLHPGPQIYGGRLVFPGSAAPQVLRAYREVTATAPETFSAWFERMHFPPAPQLPEAVRGQSFTFVDVVHLGSADEAESLIAPLRGTGPVLRETMRVLPPGELSTVAEEPEEGGPAVAVVRPLADLDDAVADALLDHGGPESGLNFVGVRHLGGALARASREDGPGVRVDASYLVTAMGIAFSPERVAPIRSGLSVLAAALEPRWSRSSTLSFLFEDAQLSEAYDAATIARLQEVKRTVDPGGVFRSNHPVPAG